MGKKIIWSKSALKQVELIHEYILEESKSLSVADKVVDSIFNSSEILSTQPELYEPDKFKLHNDGTFRAYEKIQLPHFI